MENEQVETMKMNPKNENLSKHAGLGTAKGPMGLGSLCDLLAAELKIGFWFGIGVVLAVKMSESLEYCIEELIRR